MTGTQARERQKNNVFSFIKSIEWSNLPPIQKTERQAFLALSFHQSTNQRIVGETEIVHFSFLIIVITITNFYTYLV